MTGGKRSLRRASVAATAMVLGWAAFAQQPVFQSETKLVLVDAVVTKKGEFVRDLTAKDFSIREDNKERPIRSFSLESAENHAEPHRFVLFFDNSTTGVPDQAEAHRRAADFVDASAGPNALFAAVTYDGAFRVVQPFTDNAGRMKQALAGIRLSGASAAYQQATQAADRAAMNAAASTDFRGLLQSIGNLAGSLNALPGRKTLILFTAGTVLSAARDSDLADLVKLCNRANVAVYPILAIAPAGSGANQLDCNQAMPRGRGAPPPAACPTTDTSVSDLLAKGTGGFISSIANDLPAELKRIGSEETEHYVIGFEPLETNGKNEACHDLKVKVDRPGISVRARSGYCATKQQDLLEGSKIERELEKRAAGAAGNSQLTVEAPFFYAAPNVARVHVAMQIPASVLRFETAKGKLHTELNVLGVASAADGTVAARFSDVVKRDYESKPQAVDYRKEFRIVPGQYKLVITFTAGAEFGKAEVPLTIEPFDGSHVGISAILLGNEVKPAENIGLDVAFAGEGTPLIAGGMQVVQSATARMEPEKAAFCYFEIYSRRAAEGATVRVRILDAATGAEKWDGGEGKVTTANPAGGAIPVGLALPLAGLAPGTYRVEATARDAGGEVVTRSREFETR